MPRENSRNWSREELILALDLYLRSKPALVGNSRDPRAIELAALLNVLSLREDDVGVSPRRNPSGVNMKLGNFRRLDPEYTAQGKVGLGRGGKLEVEIWHEFVGRPEDLTRQADAIVSRSKIKSIGESQDADELSFPEGSHAYRLHRIRERSSTLVEAAKRRALARTGRLACEACGFDFDVFYGELGSGYIEAHHNVPVSELEPLSRTSLKDIAILCSNCHRIVHRRRPWLTVAELRSCIEGRRQARPGPVSQ